MLPNPMAQSSYLAFTTSLTAVAATPVWTAVVIPVGSIDATITLQDATATFYVASSGGGGPTDGAPVAAGGSYTFPGATSAAISVFICPSAGTNAVLQVQR